MITDAGITNFDYPKFLLNQLIQFLQRTLKTALSESIYTNKWMKNEIGEPVFIFHWPTQTSNILLLSVLMRVLFICINRATEGAFCKLNIINCKVNP